MTLGVVRQKVERKCHCGNVATAEHVVIYKRARGGVSDGDLYLFSPHIGPCGGTCVHADPVKGWHTGDPICMAVGCRRCARKSEAMCPKCGAPWFHGRGTCGGCPA
jgi:hypothetical protein